MVNSYLKVKIDSVLESFNSKIPFLQPVYECISNSLEANATKISIVFEKEDVLPNSTVQPRITGFTIYDNGDGFTKVNRESFSEYLSKYKAKLGCKGIGRLTWLKVFREVKIESYTGQEHVTINFDKSFSEEKINHVPSLEPKQTKIVFSFVTDDYYNTSSKNPKDIRACADLNELRTTIENHLMVKLFLLKQEKSSSFEIKLKLGDHQEIISDRTIIDLEKDSFTILDDWGNNYDFNLYYQISGDKQNKRNLQYCADGRVVDEFPKSMKISKLEDSASVTMLLTSKYFDDRINNERNEFTFDKAELNPTTDAPLPFPTINNVLKEHVDGIILNRYPQIEKDNSALLEECINENPYLGKYLRSGKYGLIYDKATVLKEATSEYIRDKEDTLTKFKQMLKGNSIDDTVFVENISKLNDISNRELAQYFWYRQNIVDALKDMTQKNEPLEKVLHNLFMKQGEVSSPSDENYSPYNSNIWLLDDKFMSYTKMYRDKKIKEMKEGIAKASPEQYGDGKEPDLTMFYSDAKGNLKDVVVIELKAIGAKTDGKIVSITEINRNLGFIASSLDDLNCMYGYIITDLDDKTQAELNYQNGMKKLFTASGDPMYYFYNENITNKNKEQKPCHVYILSTKTIQEDANARNSVFLNIIKNAN